MPDWVGHLLIGVGTGRVFALRNIHVLILGALLPDAITVITTISDLGLWPIDMLKIMVALVPTNSPFVVACLCLAVSCLFDQPFYAAKLLLLGAATHVVADTLEAGHMSLLAFPFSVKAYNFTGFSFVQPWGVTLSWIFVVILIVWRMWPIRRTLHVTPRYAGWSLAILAAVAVLIGSNMSRVYKSNAGGLRFLAGEAFEEGTSIAMVSCLVTQEAPLTIKKLHREIVVENAPAFKRGELISIWGVLRDNRLVAQRWASNSGGHRILFSLIGGVLFLFYWFRLPGLDGKAPTPMGGFRTRVR